MTASSNVGDASGDRPSAGKRVVRILIVVAVFVVVFGWLLPQFIDYKLVWEAIKGLTWGQLIVLVLLAVIRVPTEALIYRAMLPGLRIIPGSAAYLSSNVAANVMPPPASSIVQYAYFRTEGFDSQTSMTGAVGTFIFPQAARLILPIPAFFVLLAVDRSDTEAVMIAAGSFVLAVLVGVLVWTIGRSENSARAAIASARLWQLSSSTGISHLA